ncbi:MAG: hypothetical protein AAF467_11975 [Actinomycetota bacterium]
MSGAETALVLALVAFVAIGGLTAAGTSLGGSDDLNEASAALGEEIVEINTSTEDGARGSSGAFGNGASGVAGTDTRSSGGINIDYDDGVWNTHRAGETFGDWTVESGSVDVKVDGRRGFNSGAGGNFIDMNGSGASGRISRTFNVISGVEYNLSVDVGENSYGGAAAKTLAIEWNGERISTLSIDLPRDEFKTFTVRIPPSPSGEATLTFESLSGATSYGPLIDDPTITLVPATSTG